MMLNLNEIENTTFDNEFDLILRDLKEITIRENNAKDNCIIWDSKNSTIAYNSFLLTKNSKSKIICHLLFYKSSVTNRYIPRPTFKRLTLEGDNTTTKSDKSVNIQLTQSNEALAFWKLIGFLNSYKEIVDLGDFENSYKLVPKESYIVEFKNKSADDKIQDLKELLKLSDLNSTDIKELTFENRKKNLKAFYYLLKNKDNAFEKYRNKFSVSQGEESIWHHFLKNNDWILGLNSDIKFIREFFDEQKVGIENSKGAGSPKTDILGISDFTLLIELKHSNTKIFKLVKGEKSRANTWDFTADFIEGVSQCLGQKFSLDKNYDVKNYISDEGKRLRKDLHRTLDPKAIFIIGNRCAEFPHDDDDTNIVKSETFERFRRNSRNVEIITFDELFEKAYHIIYSRKIPSNWLNNYDLSIFD